MKITYTFRGKDYKKEVALGCSDFYFHLTTRKWPEKIRLKPMRYDDIPSSHRCDDCYEPDLKKICVAPTIAGCLSAILPCVTGELAIYKTARKVETVDPWNVSDVEITGERWIVRPATFVKIGIIPPSILREIENEVCKNNLVYIAGGKAVERNRQRKALDIIKKYY